jgi:hypothetical protein
MNSKLSLTDGDARTPKVSDPPAPALPTPVTGLGTGRDRGPVIPLSNWHASGQTKELPKKSYTNVMSPLPYGHSTFTVRYAHRAGLGVSTTACQAFHRSLSLLSKNELTENPHSR